MKKLFFLTIIFLQTNIIFSQSDQYVGMNVIQLFANTVNVSYRINKPQQLSYLFEGGVTLNYTKAYDYPGYLLSSHWDDDGNQIEKINGGYLKIGLLIRSKKSLEKINYFDYGISLINSVIHEEGTYDYYDDYPEYYEEDIPFNQTYYKMGIGIYFGYNLKLSKRISSSFGLQTSFSLYESKECYWDYEYIPGMGLNTYDLNYRFMPVLSISYKIK